MCSRSMSSPSRFANHVDAAMRFEVAHLAERGLMIISSDSTGSSSTIAMLQRFSNVPSSSIT